MLNELSPLPGSRKPRKRVGRGPGSGKGKTCGTGVKGQGTRSGKKIKPWFEGGQMPLYQRVPKKGFQNRFRVENEVVNLAALAVEAGDADRARALLERLLRSDAERRGLTGDERQRVRAWLER